MTFDPALIALAKARAANAGIDPTLCCAICEQESAWNPWAIRDEPAFYARYVAKLHLGTTEAAARAFSWGLMQVMGQVAREHGFSGASLAALCDPAACLAVGCRVLAAKLAAAEGNVARALQLWNGGSNPNYAAAVLTRVAHYRLP